MSAGGEDVYYSYGTRGFTSRGINSYIYKDTADLHSRVMVRDANAGYHTTDTSISTHAVFTNIDTELFLERFAKDYPTFSTNSNYATGVLARNDDNGNTVILATTSGGDSVELGRGWVTDADFVALMAAWGIDINMAPNYGTVVYYTDDTYTTTNSVNIPEYETVLEMGAGAIASGSWSAEIAGIVVPCDRVKSVVLTHLVTQLPVAFLSSATHLESVDISSTKVTEIPGYFCSGCSILNSDIVMPNSITTIGDGFLQQCVSFNSRLILSSSLKTINMYFLYGCSSFNTEFAFPNGLTSISSNCLAWCTSFNQNITLPNTITSMGTFFLYKCDAMVGTVNVGTVAPTTYSDSTSFATINASAPCYLTGITIRGSNRAAWISKYPNRTSSPYRKLINGGA